MKYNPEEHHRRSIRLKEYDYSRAGAYFVTICTHHRKCLFGHIVNAQVRLSLLGEILHNEWLEVPNRFANVQLDEFVIIEGDLSFVSQLNIGLFGSLKYQILSFQPNSCNSASVGL